jgi:hypothetical protein
MIGSNFPEVGTLYFFQRSAQAARALLDINLIWFGYIARAALAYPSGKAARYFTRSNYFYLPSLRLYRKGGGGQHPVTVPEVSADNLFIPK